MEWKSRFACDLLAPRRRGILSPAGSRFWHYQHSHMHLPCHPIVFLSFVSPFLHIHQLAPAASACQEPPLSFLEDGVVRGGAMPAPSLTSKRLGSVRHWGSMSGTCVKLLPPSWVEFATPPCGMRGIVHDFTIVLESCQPGKPSTDDNRLFASKPHFFYPLVRTSSIGIKPAFSYRRLAAQHGNHSRLSKFHQVPPPETSKQSSPG